MPTSKINNTVEPASAVTRIRWSPPLCSQSDIKCPELCNLHMFLNNHTEYKANAPALESTIMVASFRTSIKPCIHGIPWPDSSEWAHAARRSTHYSKLPDVVTLLETF